jgi:hypothetical protein
VKPTLGQVFGLSLLGLIAVLAVLFYTVFKLSRETVIESSERIRDAASREIGERVTQFLTEAPNAVEQFQQEVDRGLVDARDPVAIEPALFALLLSTDDIAEYVAAAREAGIDAVQFQSAAQIETELRDRGVNWE